MEFFGGQFVFDANQSVIDKLPGRRRAAAPRGLSHSYPHCWRCKKPIIFRATEQWFISMDRQRPAAKSPGGDRPGAVDPQMGQGADLRHDREPPRLVHLPPAHLGGADHRLLLQRLRRASWPTARSWTTWPASSTKHGADVWFDWADGRAPAAGYALPEMRRRQLSRRRTTSSTSGSTPGVSHAAVLEARPELALAGRPLPGGERPAPRLVPLLAAGPRVGTRGRAPYRTVLTHGFVVDGNGRKMSKSVGNVVAPEE